MPQPRTQTNTAFAHLDVDANELVLVYRARGMSAVQAEAHAAETLHNHHLAPGAGAAHVVDEHEAIGTGLGAAVSSFCFFASGAVIPILPYLFGLQGVAALLTAAVLVGLALLITGAIVGILSGAAPFKRAVRQIAIGYGAAAATYLLGLLFGTGFA